MATSNLPAEAGLAIERPQCCLDIGNDGLHLDDQPDVRGRVNRQHVNRATLPVDVERHLHGALPAVRLQPLNHELDERCVASVEESIKGLAVPRKADLQAGAEGSRDPVEGRQSHPICFAALRASDLRSAHTRAIGDIVLAQAPPLAKRSKLAADPHDIHPRIMPSRPSRTLSGGDLGRGQGGHCPVPSRGISSNEKESGIG